MDEETRVPKATDDTLLGRTKKMFSFFLSFPSLFLMPIVNCSKVSFNT
jgi:hypothetical protein